MLLEFERHPPVSALGTAEEAAASTTARAAAAGAGTRRMVNAEAVHGAGVD